MRHLILLLPIGLAACITTGSTGGAIVVASVSRGQEISGANCIVSTNAGNWTVMTPATVMVGNVNGDLRVVCNKDGYRVSETIIRPSGPLGSSVGLGVGGGGHHVGVGVGLSVPLGIGGNHTYPSRVSVELNP